MGFLASIRPWVLVIGGVSLWFSAHAARVSRPKPSFCNLNFSQFAELSSDQLIREVLNQNLVLSFSRGSREELLRFQKAIQDLKDEDFQSEEIQNLIAKHLNVADGQRLRESLAAIREANQTLRSKAHRFRRFVSRSPWVPQRRVEAYDLPGPAGEDFSQVSDIFHSIKPGRYIEAKFHGQDPASHPLTAALSAIDALNEGARLSQEQLRALSKIDDLYEDMAKRVESFDRKVLVEGELDKQILDYLKQHKKNIEESLRAMGPRSTERLALHIPVLNSSGGALSLRVIVLENRAGYLRLLSEYEDKVKRFRALDRALSEQAMEYVQLRHVVERFRNALDLNPISERSLSREVAQELTNLHRKFQSYFSASDPTTPSQGYLRYAHHVMDPEWAKNALKKNWVRFMAPPVTVLSLAFGVGVPLKQYFWDPQQTDLQNSSDLEHFDDTDYWVQKCSESLSQVDLAAETQYESMTKCLERYWAVLLTHYSKVLQEKKEKNADYVGAAELLDMRGHYNKVSTAVHRMAPLAVQSKIVFEQDDLYLRQGMFGEIKEAAAKQKEEAEKAKREAASKADPNGSPADPGDSQRQETTAPDKEGSDRRRKMIVELSNLMTSESKKLDRNAIFKAQLIGDLDELYLFKDQETSASQRAKQGALETGALEVQKFLDLLDEQERIWEQELKVATEALKKTNKADEAILRMYENAIKESDAQLARIRAVAKPLRDKIHAVQGIVIRNQTKAIREASNGATQ